MKNFWTEQEDKILKQFYLEDDFLAKIRQHVPNRCYNAIKARANLLGMKRVILPTKDDDFFATPNIHNAVVCGFFAADGCISNGRFTISISQKDLTYLVYIKNLLRFTGNINLFTTKPLITPGSPMPYIFKGCSLQFGNCNKMIRDLRQVWGITERKTHTIKAPPIQDLKIALSFVNGLIDGDGWICLAKASNARYGNSLNINVMGTEDMMRWVKAIFDSLTPLSTEANLLKTSTTGIYSYKISGIRAYLIGKLMLKLDIIRLDRKWDKVREYINTIENRPRNHLSSYLLKHSGFDYALYDNIMDSHPLSNQKHEEKSKIVSPTV